jgi:hypothetical protein
MAEMGLRYDHAAAFRTVGKSREIIASMAHLFE